MSTAIIFGIGLFVSAMTFLGVPLVGLSEAADPAQSDPNDLTEWEWSMVREAREKNLANGRQSQLSSATHE